MKRLKWRCHRKLLHGHCTTFKVNSRNQQMILPILTVIMTPWTTLSSDPGGTAPAMKQPWQTLARHSKRVQLPTGRHGHRVWRVSRQLNNGRYECKIFIVKIDDVMRSCVDVISVCDDQVYRVVDTTFRDVIYQCCAINSCKLISMPIN